MKFKLLLFTSLLALCGPLTAQRNCASMEYLEQQIQQNPERALQLERLENFTKSYDPILEKALDGDILTISVIVHVVYNNATENISDAQVQSQIRVLNEDFRRLNADRSNTPGAFQGVAADSEIEFCLTAINRVPTNRTSFSTNDAVKSSSTGGADAINPRQALNLWVCDISGSVLGYAQFPGGAAATDGVVIDYQYMGTTGTARAPFDLGRTTTHEVGHWLNLRHIWGDGNCNADDFVNDTPRAGGPNYTGGSCTYPGPNSCNTGSGDLPDMFQNYMDYSDDGCMNLFTTGQKDRMWAAVAASRPELLTATCDGSSTPTDPNPPIADNCAAPTGLSTSTSNGGRNARFSWNAAQGAQNGYFVELYSSSNRLLASGQVSGTSASISGLSRGASYGWRVRSVCIGENSDWSIASFQALRETFATSQELGIFPNPSAASEVTITWNLPATVTTTAPSISAEAAASQRVTLELRDMTGRLLSQHQVVDSDRTVLDVANLTAGVYLVQVRNGKGYTVSSRFVKQ